jgi:membrane protease YdiL (CAAX protease family)
MSDRFQITSSPSASPSPAPLRPRDAGAHAPPLSACPFGVEEFEDWFREAPFVPARLSRLYLVAEFIVLFVGLPVLLYTQRHSLDGLVVPTLLILAGGCTWVLWKDRRFNRRQLWNRQAFRQHVARMLRWFVPGGALVAVGVAWLRPDLLMTFPQTYPKAWLLLMVTYPILSVYPQEIIFRAFLFHRYDALFPSTASKIAASSVAFGLAHIIFANWVAPIMTALGGVHFGRTYAKTGSTLQVTLEHGLWGCLAFAIGLGWYVYSGAIGL